MSSNTSLFTRTAETISFFLPPTARAEDVQCNLYGDGPFVSTKSYSETVKKAGLFHSQDRLRSVLLSYTINGEKTDSNGKSYKIIESTQFNHYEVSAGTFGDLVRCCRSEESGSVASITDVRDCWNRVFPGNQSPYNTGITSKKG